jgi:hypothetical protein
MNPRKAYFLLPLLLVTLVGPTFAAGDPQGKWEATIEGPRGANDIVMHFEGTGDELKGTWTGPRGSSDLEDVKLTDDKLSFVRNLEFQGNAITLEYAAKIDGDTMNVVMTTPRGQREFTAKRAE